MRSFAAVVAAVLVDVTCRTCRVSFPTVVPTAAPLRRPGFDYMVFWMKQYIVVAIKNTTKLIQFRALPYLWLEVASMH